MRSISTMPWCVHTGWAIHVYLSKCLGRTVMPACAETSSMFALCTSFSGQWGLSRHWRH